MVVDALRQMCTGAGSGNEPGTHAPAVHVSPIVQGLLSLQTTAVWLQAPCASQKSFVHPSLSLQGLGPPTQPPLAQVSWPVQGFPSSQLAVLLVCVQIWVVQASVVHTLPSSHSAADVHCTRVTPMFGLTLLLGEKSDQTDGGFG